MGEESIPNLRVGEVSRLLSQELKEHNFRGIDCVFYCQNEL